MVAHNQENTLCTEHTWLRRASQGLQRVAGLSDALLLISGLPQPSTQVLHSRPSAKLSPCRGCKQPDLGAAMRAHSSTALQRTFGACIVRDVL